MKNRLLTLAGTLALVAVLGKFYAVPAMAQIRAALVKNIDEPGRSPFQQTVISSGNVCASGTQCALTFTRVPVNKRLVITNVSGQVGTQGGTQVANSVQVYPAGQLGGINYYFPVSFQTSIGAGRSEWIVSQSTHAFVEPGVVPEAAAFGTGLFAFNFTITGYFVDLTQ